MLSKPRRHSSWLAELLAGAAAVSGVGYLVTAYTVSRWLTRPSRAVPHPSPRDLHLPCEDVECWTADGYHLTGWVVEPLQPRGTVLLFHGLRQNRSQTIPRIALLVGAGYRCVAFDHRAHGRSSGRYSSFGFYESRDVEAVLKLAGQRWPGQPCAAMGISMGAAALCFAGARARMLDACILESLYLDVARAFDNRIGTKFPLWFRRFSRGVIWVTERRLGIRLAQITPADHIADLAPVPLLLITGTNDAYAPPADAQALWARCAGPGELAQIDGADHTNLCTQGGDAYRQLVLAFLERNMKIRNRQGG
jgi:alpha-beta hydrolase superfamily lysophospholipase